MKDIDKKMDAPTIQMNTQEYYANGYCDIMKKKYTDIIKVDKK